MKFNARMLSTHTAVIIILILYMFPLIWLSLASIKTDNEIFSIPPVWIPERPTLDHFTKVFTYYKFGTALSNSVIIATTTTLISVVLSVLAAYGFSRYGFSGTSWIFISIFFLRTIVPASLLVPLYDTMEKLGLINTVYSVILGHLTFSLPVAVLLLKGFFDELPVELEEAAAVDGMSTLQIIRRVIFPIAIPGIVVTALFTFWGSWNEVLFSVAFTTANPTGCVALSLMRTRYKFFWGEIAAGGLLYTIPLIVIAFILQKYLVRGLTMGAIK